MFCAPGVRRAVLWVDGGPALEARRIGVVGLGMILDSCRSVVYGVSFGFAASASSVSEFRGVIRGCRTCVGDCSGGARLGDSVFGAASTADAPTPLLRALLLLADILSSYSGSHCKEVDVMFSLRVGIGMMELTSRLSTRPWIRPCRAKIR